MGWLVGGGLNHFDFSTICCGQRIVIFFYNVQIFLRYVCNDKNIEKSALGRACSMFKPSLV